MQINIGPIPRSILFHLVTALLLVVILRSTPKIESIPMEITDLLKKPTAEPNAKPRIAQPVSAKTKAQIQPNIQPQSSDSASSTVPASSNSNPTFDGSVQEEYEVSEMPILLNEIKIPYPTIAKTKGIQGSVVFDLVIGNDGLVRSASLVSSPDLSLTQAAQEAITKFKFRPARIADKPVAIRIRYSYRFVLQ